MRTARRRHQAIGQVVSAVGNVTTSRDMNVAGLSSCITLANAIKTAYNAHINDQGASSGEHKAKHTAGLVTAADADTFASLLTLVTDLTTKYPLHNTDGAAATPTYHIAQGTSRALAAVTAVTTLAGAITRLNDIKAKYNLHEADSTAHRTGSAHTVAAADGALGVAIDVPNTAVQVGDDVSWAILKAGTGTPTGVSGACVNGAVRLTFSAEPNDDTIVSYSVTRMA